MLKCVGFNEDSVYSGCGMKRIALESLAGIENYPSLRRMPKTRGDPRYTWRRLGQGSRRCECQPIVDMTIQLFGPLDPKRLLEGGKMSAFQEEVGER